MYGLCAYGWADDVTTIGCSDFFDPLWGAVAYGLNTLFEPAWRKNDYHAPGYA